MHTLWQSKSSIVPRTMCHAFIVASTTTMTKRIACIIGAASARIRATTLVSIQEHFWRDLRFYNGDC